MNIYKLLIAAFAATNVMTTFSYLVSISFKKLLKEPVMLVYILDGAGVRLKGRWKIAAGWLAHYCIGFFFVIIYESMWRYTNIGFGWLSAILFGIVSGFFGVLCWWLIYTLPNKTPEGPVKIYYAILFSAHIIFAVAVVIAFKIFDYDPLSKIT